MIVYIAGQTVFFEHGRHFLRSKLIPALMSAGADVLPSVVPWEDKPASSTGVLADEPGRASLWKARNFRLQTDPLGKINGADVVVAVLSGDEPRRQTLLELAFAAAKGKPVLGLWDDLRRDPHCDLCPTNPLAKRLIAQSGGAIYSSLQGLTKALGAWTLELVEAPLPIERRPTLTGDIT